MTKPHNYMAVTVYGFTVLGFNIYDFDVDIEFTKIKGQLNLSFSVF